MKKLNIEEQNKKLIKLSEEIRKTKEKLEKLEKQHKELLKEMIK